MTQGKQGACHGPRGVAQSAGLRETWSQMMSKVPCHHSRRLDPGGVFEHRPELVNPGKPRGGVKQHKPDEAEPGAARRVGVAAGSPEEEGGRGVWGSL